MPQPEATLARSNSACSGFLRSLRWLMGLVALALGVGAPVLCMAHCAVQDYRHEHQAGLGAHDHIGAAGEESPIAPLLIAPPPAIYPAVLAAVALAAPLLIARSVIRTLAAAFASWIRPPSAPPPRLFTA